MKKIAFVATALSMAVFAAPSHAMSDFTGPRIGGNVGYAFEGDGHETVTYAGNLGYDFALGNYVTGLTLEVGTSEDTGRDLAASVRVGRVINDKVLAYVHGGYTNLDVNKANYEGVRVGAGFEVPVTKVAFMNVEYRYSNYNGGLDANQAVVGLGFRF